MNIVALDTNIFIYFLDSNSSYHLLSKKIFSQIDSGRIKSLTSVLTLAELLSYPIPEEGIKKLEKTFLDIPNTNIMEVNLEIAREAARIRREYGIDLVDAVQLATALEGKAKIFITNDEKLKRFNKLKVLMLDQV